MALECERWQWRELVASEHGPADPSTRLVLFVLALHMNPQGENAFPAQELIAKRTGLSSRSVRTHIGLAEQGGWLKVFAKTRRGQAWFVHEYVATIPDNLAERCKSKPWEQDPHWKRAANSAGRSKQQPAEHHAENPEKAQRAANGAGHPANNARQAAIDDTTPGKSCPDARQGLPTNSSSNSSVNPSKNTPFEGAAQERRTDAVCGLKKVNEPRGGLSRSQKIRNAKEALAAGLDAQFIFKQYGLTIEDVQREQDQS